MTAPIAIVSVVSSATVAITISGITAALDRRELRERFHVSTDDALV